MAIAGALKVDCAEVFSSRPGRGWWVEPLADLNASTKDNRVQAKDKDTGLPMWSVEVLDFDPQAREKTHRVKVASAVQPVPPEAVGGVPVRPVVLEGPTVTPYVAEGSRPRIPYSLRCTGLAAPGRRAETKAA